MSKGKLFTIQDLERAWNDGFNKTHSEWKSFKVEIVMEKVAQTLQNGLDLILEDTKKSEYEKFKEYVKGCTGPK
jgi:translation initiation factor 2 gamma subunit (eIF-2gamma)